MKDRPKQITLSVLLFANTFMKLLSGVDSQEVVHLRGESRSRGRGWGKEGKLRERHLKVPKPVKQVSRQL